MNKEMRTKIVKIDILLKLSHNKVPVLESVGENIEK